MGLVNDVTEGISGLINDGNLSGLFKNVTHGLSNTTAKVRNARFPAITMLNFSSTHRGKEISVTESEIYRDTFSK